MSKQVKTLSTEAFAEKYHQATYKMQIGLGDPGFGPVASLATERADINRAYYIHESEGYFAKARSEGAKSAPVKKEATHA